MGEQMTVILPVWFFSTLYLNPICVNQTINIIPLLYNTPYNHYYELEFIMKPKDNGNFKVILISHILFVTLSFRPWFQKNLLLFVPNLFQLVFKHVPL